ncbi:hypothetical protein KF7HA_00031 [Lactococcus lactis]|nr:hypothetical protein [Lactococcus lactis]
MNTCIVVLQQQVEREILSEKIKAVFHEHKGRYGAVRITKVLHNTGIMTNTKRVGKLMHLMGLYTREAVININITTEKELRFQDPI